MARTPPPPPESWLGSVLEQQFVTQASIAAALGQLVSKADATAHRSSDEDRGMDKVNALAGLELKQQLPMLRDSDTDF